MKRFIAAFGLVGLWLTAASLVRAQTTQTTQPLTQEQIRAAIEAQTQPAPFLQTKGHGPAQFQQPVLPPVPLDGFSFSHPMTVIDRTELAEVKRRIAAHIEPQATAFAKLIQDADAAQSFHPDPPDTMDVMGGYEKNTNQDTLIRPWLWRNCHAAYASALAYAYTGKSSYADKAVEVLNAWATKETKFVGGDRGLQLGSWFSPMLYAADLLHDYDGWKPADRRRFNSWWRSNCLPYTIEKMHEHSNNWKDACILGVMSASVVLEDKSLMSDALAELQSYFSDRSDSHVTFKGAWKIQKDARGTFLPDEVIRNKGMSGINYTAYSLTTMVEALDIARYTGHDFWHCQTPEGANLQDSIERYFRWDILKQPFPWNPNPLYTTARKNVYELANDRFHLMPEIREWLEKNRPVNGAQGDEYATLNKGDMFQPATTQPAP
jgi:cell pole-organizing protein PopZ